MVQKFCFSNLITLLSSTKMIISISIIDAIYTDFIIDIQQLEYILAIDSCRYFVEAAEKCYDTQATLSMIVKNWKKSWA